MARQPLLVTAALIFDADKILIAQRRADSRVEALKWEFPGGKVEEFEHPEACLQREIREELGLEIKIDRFYEMTSHIYEKETDETGADETGTNRVHIVLLFYVCRPVGGQLQNLEVADSKWIAFSELANFEFAQADQPVVARLLAEFAAEAAKG